MKWPLKNKPDADADEYFFKQHKGLLTDPYHPMSCTLLK
jgi:hypothetical protein